MSLSGSYEKKTKQMHQFLRFIFGIKLYMFRTVPLSIIRSFSLYTQQWYMSYRFADSLRAGSGQNGRNCPKHVEFYSRNKFEKLVHLVGFIIRIYHDARSPERQIRHFWLWYPLNILFCGCCGCSSGT